MGHDLYIVGGTSRDLLLGRKIMDFDFATDATPEEMSFLEGADFAFARFGSISIKIDGMKVDITTLREESDYKDFRHPGKVKFVKDPIFDYQRRDFTINAIYLDKDYHVIDYCGGLVDLKEKVIRFIGDPNKRVKEDPLRILRARRFQKVLGFSLAKDTQRAIEEGEYLLEKLNKDKILLEERKLAQYEEE